MHFIIFDWAFKCFAGWMGRCRPNSKTSNQRWKYRCCKAWIKFHFEHMWSCEWRLQGIISCHFLSRSFEFPCLPGLCPAFFIYGMVIGMLSNLGFQFTSSTCGAVCGGYKQSWQCTSIHIHQSFLLLLSIVYISTPGLSNECPTFLFTEWWLETHPLSTFYSSCWAPVLELCTGTILENFSKNWCRFS
jgi:hypothetical protein